MEQMNFESIANEIIDLDCIVEVRDYASAEIVSVLKKHFLANPAAQPAPGWISVKEVKPERGEWYWVVIGGHVQHQAAKLLLNDEDDLIWAWADEDADCAPGEIVTHYKPIGAAPPEPAPGDTKCKCTHSWGDHGVTNGGPKPCSLCGCKDYAINK
jgi:hypothetical protein